MNTPDQSRALPVAAHTPTPLSIETSPTGCHYLKNAQGRIVASLHGTQDGVDNDARTAEDTAFRAFIVRACNSHAALVEAMEQALVAGELIAAHFDPGPIPAHEPTQADLDFGNWEYVRQQAHAALALAKATP